MPRIDNSRTVLVVSTGNSLDVVKYWSDGAQHIGLRPFNAKREEPIIHLLNPLGLIEALQRITKS
jgi:hypothetical protein